MEAFRGRSFPFLWYEGCMIIVILLRNKWVGIGITQEQRAMRPHLTGDADAWDFSESLENLGNGIIGKETNCVFKVPQSAASKTLMSS